MKIVQWPTAAVVIAGIAVLGGCVAMKADRETIAAVGGLIVAIAGAMRSMVGGAQS